MTNSLEKILKRTEWFREDRFGMFIHWGLYAIPVRGEQVKIYEKMTNEQYHQYFEAFNPVDYDPKAWAKAAKKAGMKYVVLTAKHHDGFCLFDSKYTEFKSTNTAIKRDLIAEYVEALREEGLKVGLYFSLIDWHHPDYPKYNDWHHPMSGVEAYRVPFIEFAGEKTHCFNGGMIARRRTVRMQGNLHLEVIQTLVFSNEETELLGTRKANETTTQGYQTQA